MREKANKRRKLYKKLVLKEIETKVNYIPLSKEEETYCLKQGKLSFYKTISEEERELALQYYMEVNPKFKIKYENADSKRKEILLEQAIKNSKEWRDKFLNNSQKLVMKMAQKTPYLPFDEAVQEGNIGMIMAFKKFDIEKGTKFSTYACFWIRQCINKYRTDKFATIRIPTHLAIKYFNWKQVDEEFFYNMNRRPTNEELASMTGASIKEIEEYRNYITYQYNPLSLNAYVGSDKDNTTLESFIPDEKDRISEIIDNMSYEGLKATIDQIIKDKKTKYIIRKHFGLDNDPKDYTLQDLSDELGITKQRVRYLQSKGLDKLRKSELIYRQSNINFVDTLDLKQILVNMSERTIGRQALQVLSMHYLASYNISDIAHILQTKPSEVREIEKEALEKIKYLYFNGVVNEKGKVKRK